MTDLLDLDRLEPGHGLDADLIIVGGGPAGLTLASELANEAIRVLVIESGQLSETAEHEALNTVEAADGMNSAAQSERRTAAHGPLAPSWSHAVQPYGVRCRVLGGASHAWAGKAAMFEDMDFEERSWMPHSGWPVTKAELAPYLQRAARRLNLGPNVYDDALWPIIGGEPPGPALDPEALQSFFWQFSRSRIDQFEAMRFGPEFLRHETGNIRVLLNATVTRLHVNEVGTAFTGLDVASIGGKVAHITGKACVLAASGIENARLLLASNQQNPAGLGNDHDVVGRYLIDHPAATVARFDKAAAPAIVKRFGFQGVPHDGRMHMYMHGLALSPKVKREEGLANAALFMLEDHAQDDPLLALKRLLKGDRARLASDLGAVLGSPGSVIKGIGIKAFQSDRMPEKLKASLIDTVIKINPNFAVRETLHRGVQYKLMGVRVEGITEQAPNPESRITLSAARDRLGVPMARVDWKVDRQAKRSLLRLGQLLSSEMKRTGLPAPDLESWVTDETPDEAPVIDMAHTMGSTRMAADPHRGVVDANCRVHGVSGLYIAGGSVFPTGSHVNPTLMIVTMATRLADHLKGASAQWQRA